MNWMNLCWILDEKWRERERESACRILPSSFLSHPPSPVSLPPPSASLYSRSSSSSSSSRISLFAIPTLPLFIHLLSTIIPFAHSFCFFFCSFHLSASHFLARRYKRPTDRPVPSRVALWKIFRWPNRFSIITLRPGKLQNAKAEVISAGSVDL